MKLVRSLSAMKWLHSLSLERAIHGEWINQFTISRGSHRTVLECMSVIEGVERCRQGRDRNSMFRGVGCKNQRNKRQYHNFQRNTEQNQYSNQISTDMAKEAITIAVEIINRINQVINSPQRQPVHRGTLKAHFVVVVDAINEDFVVEDATKTVVEIKEEDSTMEASVKEEFSRTNEFAGEGVREERGLKGGGWVVGLQRFMIF